MSERYCPFCGRANRSDMPRCINCGQRMLPAVPTEDGTVQQGRSVLLHEPTETQTVPASRTGSHEPWWRTADGSPFGAIPPPPQIREEIARFEAREAAKASVLRAEEAAKEAALDLERKKAAAALARAAKREQTVKDAEAASAEGVKRAAKIKNKPVVTSAALAGSLECTRCGTAPPPGGGFSFCLSCGGDLTAAPPKSVLGTLSREREMSAPTAPAATSAASHSAAAPGVNGLRSLHQSDTKKTHTTTYSMSAASAHTGVKAGSFPPGVAALLSFFVPGVGQIVNGQIAKGVVLLLASFVVTTVFGMSTMGILPLIARIIAALDAYRIADRKRKGQAVRADEWDLG